MNRLAMYQHVKQLLNDRRKHVRLDSLRQLVAAVNLGILPAPIRGDDVNNHIHTIYSFSPYSPTKAVWEAYCAGLKSAGIMDHESICGAQEFIEAGAIAGIATTIGIECRVDFSDTWLRDKRINNPDQKGNAYIALHGIPHQHIDAFKAFFEPFIAARHGRNRLMTDRINILLKPSGLSLDYDRDILPLSYHGEGGTVTERHIILALTRCLVSHFGKGEKLLAFLRNGLAVQVSSVVRDQLLFKENPFYEYDMIGLLKRELVGSFYVLATEECPKIRNVLDFTKQHGGMCAYAYLGDVKGSVTGDKKDQKFEDDHLDDLMLLLKDLGFEAVTYMPSRNAPQQVDRIMELCKKNGFLQISGEDINSPRQSFVCKAMRHEKFRHLVDATWALIGHEYAATQNSAQGFFSNKVVEKYPDINERIQEYKKIGLQTLPMVAEPLVKELEKADR